MDIPVVKELYKVETLQEVVNIFGYDSDSSDEEEQDEKEQEHTSNVNTIKM